MSGKRASGSGAWIVTLAAAGVVTLAAAWPGRAQTPSLCDPAYKICIALPIVRAPEPTPTPVCVPIPGAHYDLIPILGAPTDHPAAEHPDLNLALRGYGTAPDYPAKALVDYDGGANKYAPRLTDLFADHRAPVFVNLYRVNQWDGQWPGHITGPITDWPVTLAGLSATPGEPLHLPGTFESHEIYGGGYHALVLYATEERITLKYTQEDDAVAGYTLHLEGICVDPTLVARYNQTNAAGRYNLPALRPGQALGRARTDEVKLAIRDAGSFMDPRSRRDWWRDIPSSGGVELWPVDEPWFQAHQQAIATRRGEVH